MKQTKWTQVEMTAPAVIGFVLGIAGTVLGGPLWGALAFALGIGPLAAYRIASRP